MDGLSERDVKRGKMQGVILFRNFPFFRNQTGMITKSCRFTKLLPFYALHSRLGGTGLAFSHNSGYKHLFQVGKDANLSKIGVAARYRRQYRNQ